MRRLREGDERTPQPPGGDGAPLGGTMTSRQELADGGPTRANAALGCQKRGPSPTRRRDGAPKGAALSARMVRIELHDALSRRAIPSHFLRGSTPPLPLFARDEMEYGSPGAAKNTGGEALACLAEALAKAGCLTFESARRRNAQHAHLSLP